MPGARWVLKEEELTLLGEADRTFVANGQLVPALGTAPGQNGTAILGLHASAEAMSLGALVIIRLKCSLRHIGFPLGCPAWPLESPHGHK
jgi:hypothetical protein